MTRLRLPVERLETPYERHRRRRRKRWVRFILAGLLAFYAATLFDFIP